MKTIDLGLIKGEKGDRGEQGAAGAQGLQGVQGVRGVQGVQGEIGKSISLKMGSCTFVETKEEAGAELYNDGDGVYILNLRLPKPIDGGGDMKMMYYDKNDRREDIYEYIDKNAMTLEGGEFRGSVYLKGEPEAEREAATKGYCDEGDSAVKKETNEILESLKECDAFIKRDVDGAIIFSEDEILINPGINASESDISEEEVIIDSKLFTIDFGQERTWVYMQVEFEEREVKATTTGSGYAGSLKLSLLNEQGTEMTVVKSGGTNDVPERYYNIKTPGKYKIRLILTGKGTVPVTSYSIKLNKVTCVCEERCF